MLGQNQILQLFRDNGALLNGHFELSSGLHSAQYLQCALLLQHPPVAALLSEELSRKFEDENVGVVVAPAIGGIILAYEVARALGARSLFCERKNGKMTLRRGFKLKTSERVLIVEDVITTGASVKEIVQIVRRSKAELTGIGVLVDRSCKEKDFGARYERLVKLDIKDFPPDQCPLCKQGLPLIKPGSKQS
jgi:orotate phosphoribosyltransferase